MQGFLLSILIEGTTRKITDSQLIIYYIFYYSGLFSNRAYQIHFISFLNTILLLLRWEVYALSLLVIDFVRRILRDRLIIRLSRHGCWLDTDICEIDFTNRIRRICPRTCVTRQRKWKFAGRGYKLYVMEKFA